MERKNGLIVFFGKVYIVYARNDMKTNQYLKKSSGLFFPLKIENGLTGFPDYLPW